MNARAKRPATDAALAGILRSLAVYARAAGIGRRDFARIAAQAFGRQRQAPSRLVAAWPEAGLRITGRWLTERAYCRGGKPRPLPFSGARSFSALAKAARAGAPRRALSVLREAGIVAVDRAGLIHLRECGYVPKTGTPEQIEMFGRAGAEFIRLLVHNISAPRDAVFLQRAASYDNIGAHGLLKLRKRLREEGLQALTRANATLANNDRDRNARAPGGRRTRVSFGVYYFEEPVAARRKR